MKLGRLFVAIIALLGIIPLGAHASEERFALVRTLPAPGGLPTSAVETAAASCPTTTRATADRPDIGTGRLVHVIFLVSNNGTDDSLDKNGTLECSLQAQQQWFGEQTGLAWRFDTYLSGGQEYFDVTYVKSTSNSTSLDSGGEVRSALQNLGFNKTNKRYLTYVTSGGGGACGDAFYPISPGTGAVDGVYAQVYLDSANACGARAWGTPGAPNYSEVIPQQEILHNDGLVPIGSPHTCAHTYGHICTPGLGALGNIDPESSDIMFPYVGRPLSQKVVDRGHDDYFQHGVPLVRHLENGLYFEPA